MGLPRQGRNGVLAAFAAATFVLLGAGVVGARMLLTTSLDHAADQDAGQEARLVANLGLAAALSRGHLSGRDLQLATDEYDVARRVLPLAGASVWTPGGVAVFAQGAGRAAAHTARLPRLARLALRSHRSQVINVSERGVGAAVEVAVPLGSQGLGSVAEFQFSRQGVARDLAAADERLYILTGAAALVMYLAILPLLARLARRVPLPADPARRAALAELKVALARRELTLHYQPKTEVQTGRVVGVEALVRWNHPRRGLLGPAGFLPIAESHTEVLASLTCQVLDHALRDCLRWQRDGMELPVAINVAAPVLADGLLAPIVRETLDRYELDPRLLTIEITESALMEQGEDITQPLRELRALGARISIDDFGTGHSSLARLRSLPLDELKVDRSFIAGIAADERDLGIARHIVELGVDLGLVVVAEGVEDEMTLRLVKGLGCAVAQGFFMARPLPEQQLRLWLEGRQIGDDVRCRS